jgi:putative membrane protein
MKIRAAVILFVKGMVVGVANIIPGVSGGTLAVVLGIYDRLIEAISNIFNKTEKRKAYFIFLATIFFGAFSSILLLANVMDYLLTNYYELTLFAFMGLIFGGIPVIWREHSDMEIRASRLVAFSMGILLVIIPAFLVSGGGETPIAGHGEVPVLGIHGYAILILAGFFAGGGMIVPGISGSFILVLMGQYAIIISAVKGFAVAPLIAVASSAAVGILVFSKIIETCLKKVPAGTYYFILGLVIASLWQIFPGVPVNASALLAGGAVFLAGAGVSCLMSKVSLKTP